MNARTESRETQHAAFRGWSKVDTRRQEGLTLRTKVSTKGQVILPRPIRRRLGLQPGDSLDDKTDGERTILTPRRARRGAARIIKDPVTGLPVLTAGADATRLTGDQVGEILTDFP